MHFVLYSVNYGGNYANSAYLGVIYSNEQLSLGKYWHGFKSDVTYNCIVYFEQWKNSVLLFG
jgi:hypothetical protein